MLASAIPKKMTIPFANSAGPGYTRVVPVASQIGIQDGAASFTDGFPPLTMTPEPSGGVPPFGQDINGLLKVTTAWLQWVQAGAPINWDSSFSASIGGYPRGAVVGSPTLLGTRYLSTTDNNTTNPDSGGAGWVSFGSRTILAADASFFVSLTGSDSNVGSSGSPWATVQHAWDVVQTQYDLAGHRVTVSLSDGTYTAGLLASGLLVGGAGGDALTLTSLSGNASACIINTPTQQPVEATDYASLTVTNLTLVSAGRDLLHAHDHATIYHSGLRFGATSNSQIRVGRSGVVEVQGNYEVFGGATSHYLATRNGTINILDGISCTVTGTPAFSGGFAQATNGGLLYCTGPGPISYTGGATGPQYVANLNGVINTNQAVPGAAGFFPGSTTVAPTTGGQYV